MSLQEDVALSIRRRKPPYTDDPNERDRAGEYDGYTASLLAAAIHAEDWLREHHEADCRAELVGGTCSCGAFEIAEELSGAIDADEEPW